ncbi:glycosyltransferase [Plastorhodobacter daqingensis]|uniref:Glycosyltransferase n=1 Tax=Plastorhodobacter daqingensis TaxID=1387281 RepID=A0ABW2UM38_9RHOB
MRILLVHQNFPGQFLHLAPALRDRGHEVLALTAFGNKRPSPVPVNFYRFDPPPLDPGACRLGRSYTEMTDRATAVARAALVLRDRHGYEPDVIFGHCGWGETLFLREVWPRARLLVYAEFYHGTEGRDTFFDPEFSPRSFAGALGVVARTAAYAQALAQADAALSPTHWQASTFPESFRPKISVIHDGVDTVALRPDPAARYRLPDLGAQLHAGQEILTYVARNLEPYRGFPQFMRALPAVLQARPDAQVLIVGGNDTSYGRPPEAGGSWKDVMLHEVGGKLDLHRVHFLGRVPYQAYVRILQISRVHCYLTVPFVLSWSLIEAMSMGAMIVASDTAPVREVIHDGKTGRLVDFFDTGGLSAALIRELSDPGGQEPLRAAARDLAVRDYDFRSACLPRLIDFVEIAGR